MGLREQAALDAKAILEDLDGFSWPFALKSPDGVVTQQSGFATDIGQTIDPETGQSVAGRQVSVSCSLLSLAVLPAGIANENRKPWVVTFENIQELAGDWKVIEVLPDRALGVVVLLLEAYHAGAHI